MQRLIFVNRFFFPDYSATGQILSDLSFELAAAGQDVHVITSRQRYDEPDAALAADEIVNGVKVHRIASTEFGRSNLFGRAVDYLSFYRSVRHRLGEIMRPGDAVIAKTDPPLLSVAVASTVRARRGRLVNWLQDIYPETATALRVPMIRGPIAAALRALRNRALRNADATIVVGETMARRIATFGIAPERIHVIPNWCDDEAIRPVVPVDNPLRVAWQVTDKFVVGYSGNLGRAHEFETILATAEQLRDEPRIAFLMIGGGRGFEDLARAVKARGLEGLFRFRSYQERAMLPFSLGVPNVHWLSLNPQLEGLVVPSKFYGIAAAGRPIVMIGDREGEIARLVRRHRCGITVTPGEFGILAQTLRCWLNAPQAIGEMGARARQMLDAQFTRRQALDQWRRLLDQLASPLTFAA
jgi:glycosyltransferase involved in cell wall biosynthesis